MIIVAAWTPRSIDPSYNCIIAVLMCRWRKLYVVDAKPNNQSADCSLFQGLPDIGWPLGERLPVDGLRVTNSSGRSLHLPSSPVLRHAAAGHVASFAALAAAVQSRQGSTSDDAPISVYHPPWRSFRPDCSRSVNLSAMINFFSYKINNVETIQIRQSHFNFTFLSVAWAKRDRFDKLSFRKMLSFLIVHS